ncbi:hypothetical protein ACQCT6_06370 [Cytobacillus gottheilii]|uniref:Uncharacterized protein n=1 Tax=Cytobacillus gottheilii TaxID=859144 RepID=A0ABX8FGE1_9BACI|nr:hypothetical protein [Cytobacillus gottheilii]QVY63070.1 hypothetical protein J1899_08510 [Cytobacillus gottheilii]
MAENQIKQFDQIVKMGEQAQKALNDYWLEFSLYTSFEYWLMVSILIVPLIILFFKIDKNQIFLMGFYGYSVHVIFGYVDLYTKNSGFLNYPFPVIPMLPGISLDSSLVPVTFMLVYQWVVNHQKNYILYMGITSAFLAFVFKPILVALGLIRLYGNTNYFHLFLAYLLVITIAKFLTNVFLWMEKKFNNETTDAQHE